MRLYKPLQHLFLQKATNTEHIIQSTVTVLLGGGKTLTREKVEDKKDYYLITYKVISDDQESDSHTFDDVVNVARVPDSRTTPYNVKVIVYMDGSPLGEVTTTISQDAQIEIE